MALQFSDRHLTDGIIELLHNMYYYGARWGLSVADYTGKNRKYWEVLPSKLRAAQGHPKRLEACLGELQGLADDAPNRDRELRVLVKGGGFQKKEVVVNEQLVALLAALPQELLAKFLGRLTSDDVLPSPARFVKEHLGGEQLIEPDFLVMADRHLLMGELKIKPDREKPDPKYDANKLCNYLSLVYKCRQGKDNSLPTRFSHLVLLPSIHHRWFVRGAPAGRARVDRARGHARPAARTVPGLGPGMGDARAVLVGRLLRMLVLAFALWVASEALDLRGPDPEVPRSVLDAPSEHELEPKGCGSFC